MWMTATEVSQETTVLAAFSFFSKAEGFCKPVRNELGLLPDFQGVCYFEASYTQLSRSDTDALELLVELISIYFSGFFLFAEHGFYTSSHTCVCSKFIRRFTNV